MSFKRYLTERKKVKKIPASMLEQAIPHIWSTYLESGNDINETLANIDAKYLEYFNRENIAPMIKKLSEVLVNKPLIFIGTGGGTVRDSEFWKKYAINTESSDVSRRGPKAKTDFHTPDTNHKIAFLQDEGFLVNGSQGEVKGIFYAAYEEFKEKPQGFEHIIKMASERLKQVKIKNTLEKLDGRFKVLKDILAVKFNELELDINKESDIKKFASNDTAVSDAFEEFMELRTVLSNVSNVRELKDMFLKDLQKFFSENEEFKPYFIREAITGLKKFEDTPIGIANYLMTTDPFTGDSRIRLIDMEFCRKIAKSINIRIRVDFKTNIKTHPKTGEPVPGVANAALKVDTTNTNAMYDEGFKNNKETLLDEWVEEYMLTEGLFSNAKNWLSNLYHWLYKKISQAARKGLDYLLDLLGVDVTVHIDQTKFSIDMIK